MNVVINDKGQAIPTHVEHIKPEAFDAINETQVRWLSGGAAMINSRGTVIMIDPVLEGFDMPLTYDPHFLRSSFSMKSRMLFCWILRIMAGILHLKAQ